MPIRHIVQCNEETCGVLGFTYKMHCCCCCCSKCTCKYETSWI